MVPNLLGGKLLTGVLPIEKQEVYEPWLPSHSPIMDIESCIDDPTLAPLGGHIRQQPNNNKPIKKSRKKDNQHKKNGQVKIQKDYDMIKNNNKNHHYYRGKNGLLMLRRKNLTDIELADHLNSLLLKKKKSKPVSTAASSFLQLQPDLKKSDYFDHLVELDISRNKLSNLPSEITLLHQLRTLNASSNLLTDIPSELYHLTQLQVLILSQNQLHTIPDELPLRLPLLMTLSVAGNMIDYLTPNIDQWVYMKHLQLGSVFGGNRLSCLPDTIAHMGQLEELDVSYNLLSSLPPNMLIPSLLHLNASRNQLDSLPSSIGQCHKLKTLNVSSNHLTTLPCDLANLQNLELLDISENLLCIMPADILERMKTTLLITGNPLTRPGHCDIYDSNDAYAQVLKRMTMRAVPMMTSLSSTSTSSTSSNYPHQCGPQGTGCLGTAPSSLTSSPSPSPSTSTFTNLKHIPLSSSPPIPSLLSSSLSPSSSSSSSTPYSSNNHYTTHPKPIHPLRYESTFSSSSTYVSSPLSRSPTTSQQVWYGDNDDDSLIDRELSYLAQQLNVQGSKRDRQSSSNNNNNNSNNVNSNTNTNTIIPSSASPFMTPISSPRLRNEDVLLTELSYLPSSPPLPSSNSPILARSYSPFDEEMFFSRSLLMDSSPSSSPPSTTAPMATTATISSATGSTSNMDLDRDPENSSTPLVDNNYCTLVNNDHGEGPLSPSILATTNIVHSLRELATRVILNSNRNNYPLHMIPPHLAKDLSKSPRWCAHCQRAFVNEWLTSVEIKSYRGHPAVVRRVRFCSTKCWQLYLHSKKSMVCVHRAESQTIERDSADQEESEFLQASLIADDMI